MALLSLLQLVPKALDEALATEVDRVDSLTVHGQLDSELRRHSSVDRCGENRPDERLRSGELTMVVIANSTDQFLEPLLDAIESRLDLIELSGCRSGSETIRQHLSWAYYR